VHAPENESQIRQTQKEEVFAVHKMLGHVESVIQTVKGQAFNQAKYKYFAIASGKLLRLMMNANQDIRAVHRSQGILQCEIADYVFSMSAITAGQNTWLRFNQNCEKVASAAYTLRGTEEMSHTSPQCESTKAGCDDRAQGVAFLDLYRVQFASNGNSNPIFVGCDGQLQSENTRQNSAPLDSHSDLQQQNST